VATIGVFDGVHRGHQQIVGRAVQRAQDSGLPSVVLTFDPHPSEVVRPGSHPPVLTANRRKAELLEALGVDVMCVLPFTLEFSHLTAAEFVHEVLVEHLHAAAVVVGENFRFGHRAAGDVAGLKTLGARLGFATEGVPLLSDGEVTISSTYVRSCVDAGDVAAAAHALGRDHRVEGLVVRGDRRGGAELGFPTANLRVERYAAIPADGVYAGRLVRRGSDQRAARGAGSQRGAAVAQPDARGAGAPTGARTPAGAGGGWARPAAISVGTNPTFEGRERRVEAYVLDFDGDLYGENVGVDFRARLRAMERFDRVEDLIAQMKADVERTRQLID
jgi:riboflavin kinase/FMN adenylyltransferase